MGLNEDEVEFNLEKILGQIGPDGRDRVIALAALDDKTKDLMHIDTAVAWLRANGYHEKSALLNSRYDRYDESLKDLMVAGKFEDAYAYALDNNLKDNLEEVETRMLMETPKSALYIRVIKNHLKRREFKEARAVFDFGIVHFEVPNAERAHPDYNNLLYMLWKATDLFADEKYAVEAENIFTQGEDNLRKTHKWDDLASLYQLRIKLEGSEQDAKLLGKLAEAYYNAGYTHATARIYLKLGKPKKAIKLYESYEQIDEAMVIAKKFHLDNELKRLQDITEKNCIEAGHYWQAAYDACARGDLEHAIGLAKQGLPKTSLLLCTYLAEAGRVGELCNLVESLGLYNLFDPINSQVRRGGSKEPYLKVLEPEEFQHKLWAYRRLADLKHELWR
jgi:tetratricopeptide (TPR) repeat protein